MVCQSNLYHIARVQLKSQIWLPHSDCLHVRRSIRKSFVTVVQQDGDHDFLAEAADYIPHALGIARQHNHVQLSYHKMSVTSKRFTYV